MDSYLFIFSSNKTIQLRNKISELINIHFGEKTTKLLLTKSRTDAIEQIKNHSEYKVVVAIGGDGTINSVAQAVVNTHHILGIIPMGSGNGFARNVFIPLKLNKSFESLANSDVKTVDAVDVNGVYALNVFGLGFDAAVVHHFENMPVRGFLGYTLAVIKTLFTYKPYVYTIDGENQQSFLLVIANGEQYGFNTRIAPQAKLDDGILNRVNVNSLKWWLIPKYVYSLATNKRVKHSSIQYSDVSMATIELSQEGYYQLDGEGFSLNAHSPLHIKVCPNSVQVLVPKIR